MKMVNEKVNYKKYSNSILYFLKYCNTSFLGATKLNKLLYYLDFISYRDRGKSITGDLYVHKDFGPVPDTVDNVLVKMKEKGDLSIDVEPWKDNVVYKFKNLDEPDLSAFDKYELSLLEKICGEFELWSTDKIVNQTHLEAPWFYSKPYEIVDYKYASSIEFFIDDSQLASK